MGYVHMVLRCGLVGVMAVGVYHNMVGAQVVVRPAVLDDLDAVIALDREVSFEYFKPLYEQYYGAYDFGKNAQDSIAHEVAGDAHDFEQALREPGDQVLHVAHDQVADRLAGFAWFHADDTLVTIDLLFVGAAYRRQGVGKKLFDAVLKTYPRARECFLYTLKGNHAARSFWEQQGFTTTDGDPDQNSCYGVPHDHMYYYHTKILRP